MTWSSTRAGTGWAWASDSMGWSRLGWCGGLEGWGWDGGKGRGGWVEVCHTTGRRAKKKKAKAMDRGKKEARSKTQVKLGSCDELRLLFMTTPACKPACTASQEKKQALRVLLIPVGWGSSFEKSPPDKSCFVPQAPCVPSALFLLASLAASEVDRTAGARSLV